MTIETVALFHGPRTGVFILYLFSINSIISLSMLGFAYTPNVLFHRSSYFTINFELVFATQQTFTCS